MDRGKDEKCWVKSDETEKKSRKRVGKQVTRFRLPGVDSDSFLKTSRSLLGGVPGVDTVISWGGIVVLFFMRVRVGSLCD